MSNVSKSVETALKTAIMAGGSSGTITADDCNFELFQDTDHEHDARLPVIAITAAPDVPDGMGDSGVSSLRRLVVRVTIATQTPADRTRATLVSLYDRVRSALDEANANLTTWSQAHLPTGWFANCVLVEDSAEPYCDDDFQTFDLSVRVEVCVS